MGLLAMAPGHLPLSTLALVHLPMTVPPISATHQSLPFGITCLLSAYGQTWQNIQWQKVVKLLCSNKNSLQVEVW